MITLEIGGIKYINFVSISVERSIENVYGTFNFAATIAQGDPFPIKVGAPCRIFVNNTPIVTGYIDKLEVKSNATQRLVNGSGRDLTCDIYDSQVDGDIEFVPPVTLENVIKITASKINMPNIKIINEAGTIDPFQQSDLVSARIGETAFSFIEHYSRKRQVFVTTDGLGNIVLARGSTQQIVLGGLYMFYDDTNSFNKNNILDSSSSIDFTKRFNLYRCKSQDNIAAIYTADGITSDSIVDRDGTAVDASIRKTRILNFNAESSSDDGDAINRAVWEANIRRSRSSVYTVTVQGDSYDGINPWRVNRLVQVIDEPAGINAQLLIRSINFSLSVDQGTTTTLELVTPDGYTPKADLSNKEKRSNDLGDQYIYKVPS